VKQIEQEMSINPVARAHHSLAPKFFPLFHPLVCTCAAATLSAHRSLSAARCTAANIALRFSPSSHARYLFFALSVFVHARGGPRKLAVRRGAALKTLGGRGTLVGALLIRPDANGGRLRAPNASVGPAVRGDASPSVGVSDGVPGLGAIKGVKAGRLRAVVATVPRGGGRLAPATVPWPLGAAG
jgi:hypothetical protein